MLTRGSRALEPPLDEHSHPEATRRWDPAVGAAALVASRSLAGDQEWWSSLLLETGITLFLLLPLLLFERVFERRVQRVRQETAADVAGVREEIATVRAELGQLQGQTEERLTARREADEATVRQAREDVSSENVIRLLDLALGLGAVGKSGVRVPVQDGPRVQFEKVHLRSPGSPARQEFSVSVVDVRGESEVEGVVWEPNERGPAVIARLIEAWQRKGTYPGQGFLDADKVFELAHHDT